MCHRQEGSTSPCTDLKGHMDNMIPFQSSISISHSAGTSCRPSTSHLTVYLNIYAPTKSNRSDEPWLSDFDTSKYANACMLAANL